MGCDGYASAPLDPSVGPGNAYSTPGAFASNSVWQYAVYEGREQLECDGKPCDKNYWNVAVGVEGLPAGCTLSAKATAADHELTDGTTPANTAYPIINFGPIDLTDSAGVICSQNKLGTDGDVTVSYTGFGVGTFFKNVLKPVGDGVSTVRLADPTPTARDCVAQATGNWEDPGTWTNCAGGVPGQYDNATISTAYTVTFNGNISVANLNLSDGHLVTGSEDYNVTVQHNFNLGAGAHFEAGDVTADVVTFNCHGADGSAGQDAVSADVTGGGSCG